MIWLKCTFLGLFLSTIQFPQSKHNVLHVSDTHAFIYLFFSDCAKGLAGFKLPNQGLNRALSSDSAVLTTGSPGNCQTAFS